MRKGWAVGAVLLLAGMAAGWSPLAAATAFATPAFEQQWKAGEAITPNFWGPLATATDGQQEPYGEPRGRSAPRAVFRQGTDGSRSRIDVVTNGLLATELIKGQIQIGRHDVPAESVARTPDCGRPDNPGPTYAMLGTSAAAVLAPTMIRVGGFVQVAISPTGDYGMSRSHSATGGATGDRDVR